MKIPVEREMRNTKNYFHKNYFNTSLVLMCSTDYICSNQWLIELFVVVVRLDFRLSHINYTLTDVSAYCLQIHFSYISDMSLDLF